MRRCLCLVGLLALVGCDPSPQSPTSSPPSAPAKGEAAGPLYVLSVPNMTWGGCAASVRGALTSAGGFTNIQTDVANKTCQFNYSGTEAELWAKLDELAKENSHIRDWKKKTWK